MRYEPFHKLNWKNQLDKENKIPKYAKIAVEEDECQRFREHWRSNPTQEVEKGNGRKVHRSDIEWDLGFDSKTAQSNASILQVGIQSKIIS